MTRRRSCELRNDRYQPHRIDGGTAEGGGDPRAGGLAPLEKDGVAAPVDFAQALKTSLEQVNGMQKNSEKLSQRFALGDDSVNLSDMMIAMQKASISLQATVQVRNKLVSAYQDIMNMQV